MDLAQAVLSIVDSGEAGDFRSTSIIDGDYTSTTRSSSSGTLTSSSRSVDAERAAADVPGEVSEAQADDGLGAELSSSSSSSSAAQTAADVLPQSARGPASQKAQQILPMSIFVPDESAPRVWPVSYGLHSCIATRKRCTKLTLVQVILNG